MEPNLGKMEHNGVTYWHVHLSNVSRAADIGAGTVIHAGVHIHDEVVIGERCQIQAEAMLFNGVTLEDEVFIGPSVIFTNDPKLDIARNEWKPTPTLVKKGAKIGAGAMIRAGVTIGEGAVVGMGSVVLDDVPAHCIVVGNPAKLLKKL